MSDATPGRITRGAFVAGTATSALALHHAGSVSADAATLAPASRDSDVTIFVNGTERRLHLDPRVTLLDALRDRLGLTGTKKGCDQGQCGACTVLLNGRRVNSCLTLAVMHDGERVTTVEGLASADGLHPLQQAFIEHDAFQCGYCTPGQLMSAVGMQREGHAVERDVVREQMSGNICRCGCYPHIVDAIMDWQTQD
jgi:xanthine dehydrogenase YagT iron-sulfur-binding subunit